jgi:hypothetical protein
VKSASDWSELASDEVVLVAARLERLPESAAASRIVGRAAGGSPLRLTKARCSQEVLFKRATGLEPATSSLEGWRSTN